LNVKILKKYFGSTWHNFGGLFLNLKQRLSQVLSKVSDMQIGAAVSKFNKSGGNF